MGCKTCCNQSYCHLVASGEKVVLRLDLSCMQSIFDIQIMVWNWHYFTIFVVRLASDKIQSIKTIKNRTNS